MSLKSTQELRIGLLGLGQVGGGVLRLLSENADGISARLGRRIKVVRAFVRDTSRVRVAEAAQVTLTTNASEVVDADDIDVVVEVMGGIDPARELILRAVAQGKAVVTANKALLAENGPEIFTAATSAKVDLLFEAAVCGGIPIIRTLREALASDRIDTIRGIVNGTTNYILSAMEDGSTSYAEALKQAQELGFAEADPTFDVSGRDVAQKLLLLTALSFGRRVNLDNIPTDGIERVDAVDFKFAREFGCTIRMLATARHKDGRLVLSAAPTLVPLTSQLAAVRGPFNAVEIRSFALGPALLVGQGAGALPTASAVVSDIIEAGRNLIAGAPGRVPHLAWINEDHGPKVAEPLSKKATWYLRFLVADEPGVLARIAGTLGERNIGIAAVIQRERSLESGAVPVVVETHEAPQGAVLEAVRILDEQSFARGSTVVMPFDREE